MKDEHVSDAVSRLPDQCLNPEHTLGPDEMKDGHVLQNTGSIGRSER